MTKEELWNEAKTRVDAFIDNFSQDIRSTLYDRLNQEDVKDFLYGLYIDSAEPREKKIEELEKENRLLGERCNQLLKDKGNLTDQIANIKANCDLDIEGRDVKIMELEKENSKLEKQIVDLKDYVFKVSKFLHNTNNVRPDNLAYKERDVLLIKELKLFEKWGLSK